jgi:Na+/melibiose symporter-like transporter
MSLSRPQLIAYGLPGAPMALLGIPLVLYLPPAYAQDFGLGLGVVGSALLVARLWDLVSDPLVGVLGDRIRSGARRKLTMLLGAGPLLVAVDQLFWPDAPPDTLHLLLWGIVLYTGWTLVVVPYGAWGAELSSDYQERSRVTASREAFVLVGTLIAVLLPEASRRLDWGANQLETLALAFWLLLPAALLIAWTLVPEPKRQTPLPSWRTGIRLLRRNRPFRRLLGAYIANGMANAIPASLFLLYVEHWLGVPEQTWLFLAVYFAAGLAGFGLWLPLSARLGKHRGWSLSMLFACAVFAWVPFIPAGDSGLFILVCVLTGLSLGVDMSLPAAIQADVLDLDRAEGGGERAGLFFGLWGMGTKLALALAVGVAYPLLDLVGFDPGTGGAPAVGAEYLMLAYGLLPIPFKLLAAALIWRFPLDAARLGELQGRLDHADPPKESLAARHRLAPRRVLDGEA